MEWTNRTDSIRIHRCRLLCTDGNGTGCKFKIVLDPSSKFAGRSLTKVGLREYGSVYVVSLEGTDVLPLDSFDADDPSILSIVDMPVAKKLQDGKGKFTALKSGKTKIRAKKGTTTATYDVEVLLPKNVRVYKNPGSDWASTKFVDEYVDDKPTGKEVLVFEVRFFASIYVNEPRGVSFSGLSLKEWTAVGVAKNADGTPGPLDGYEHPMGKIWGGGGASMERGTIMIDDDQVYTTRYADIKNGYFKWDIPYDAYMRHVP